MPKRESPPRNRKTSHAVASGGDGGLWRSDPPCRTRKILVEKESIIEVPVSKSVVDFHCPGCGDDLSQGNLSNTLPTPMSRR